MEHPTFRHKRVIEHTCCSSHVHHTLSYTHVCLFVTRVTNLQYVSGGSGGNYICGCVCVTLVRNLSEVTYCAIQTFVDHKTISMFLPMLQIHLNLLDAVKGHFHIGHIIIKL